MNTPLTKEELIESLGIIRRSHCAYGGWTTCDCKYTLLKYNKVGYGEEDCGCAEISQAIVALLGLSEEEYKNALMKGNKNEGLCKALFDRNPK